MTPTLDPQLEQPPDETVVPEPPTESPYGVRNEELPEQLVNAIRSAVKKSQTEERYLRRLEVLHDRRNRFYERGHQHIYEGRDDCFVLAVPGASFWDAEGNEEEWGDYIDDYPIFHGFIWIIQSVLTQNGPGIAFEPKDPSLSEDNQAAETAEGLRRHFDRVNDVKKILREVVRMLCLSGRVVVWTKTEENAARWGRKDDGSPIKNQTSCVFGTLETKVPIMERDQCNFPYLIIYRDVDVRNAKQDHPHIKDKIKANQTCLEEHNYERFARLGVLQGARSQFQAGEAISHLLTEGHIWLRPSCFSDEEFDEPFRGAKEEDLNEEGNVPSVREMLAKVFADKQGGFTGLHTVFMGDTYSMSWPESMDDCTTTEQPFVGDGQFAMAIMDAAVVAQDRFNTLMNYIAETFDFGAPSTWVYANKVDYESYLDQKAQPYGIRQLKQMAPTTNAAADNFYREPNPEIPATLQTVIQFLMGEFLQFVLACPPAMWGESSEDTKTASGLAQSRNQALGRMGIIWAVLQRIAARMYYQSCLAASNDPDTPEEIILPSVQTGGQNVTVKVERLRKGHFMARPDEDSGFPDSTAAKRATLMTLVQLAAQFPPAAQQLFAVPKNWKESLTLLGFPELILPEAESYDKQTEEIEELLNGVPVDPTPDEVLAAQQQAELGAQQSVAAGLPPPPPFDPQSLVRSSVPIKPWDFDEYEEACCLDYLNSNAARLELKVGRADPMTGETAPNIRGIQNVWLHAQEHAKAKAMKQPPMPPVPIVAPKGGKPAGQPPGGPLKPESAAAGSPGTATL